MTVRCANESHHAQQGPLGEIDSLPDESEFVVAGSVDESEPFKLVVVGSFEDRVVDSGSH